MEEMDTRGTMNLRDLEANIKTLIPDIALAAEKPNHPNPFSSKFEFTTWDKVQLYTIGLILIPLRLIITFISFLFASLFAKICLIGYTPSDSPEPFTGFRRVGQYLLWGVARFLLFVYGFWYIPTKGRLSDIKHAPVVVVAPHTSLMDGLLLSTLRTLFSAVGRHENNQIFLIGSILQMIQPLTVNRTQKNSKQRVVKEIDRRVKGNWPRLVIFPEGNNSNFLSTQFFTF
ncbi:lysophosphatidylcholine acyltransferase 2-like [Clytia hemisphaerica]|uniref:Phospholipid/glycerol acyltransferase domain-containing protein n=1 Tax=Clytia hemisphaerica TaxID=252671 RepID=A0A7M5WSJ0_9CNID